MWQLLLGIAGVIAVALVGEEVVGWANTGASWLLRRRFRRVSEPSRSRYLEQTQSDLERMPGPISRLVWAFGSILMIGRLKLIVEGPIPAFPPSPTQVRILREPDELLRPSGFTTGTGERRAAMLDDERRNWEGPGPAYTLYEGQIRPSDAAMLRLRVRTTRARLVVLAGEVLSVSVVSTVVDSPLRASGWNTGLVAVGVLVAWLSAQAPAGALSRRTLDSSGVELFRTVLLAGSAAALLILVAVATFPQQVPRWTLGVVILLTMGSLVVRGGARALVWSRRRNQKDLKRTILVGDEATVIRRSAAINLDPYNDVEVVGCCLPVLPSDGSRVGVPVLGSIADIPQAVVDCDVDAVLITSDALPSIDPRRLRWALDDTGAQIYLDWAIRESLLTGTRVVNIGGAPALRLSRSWGRSERLPKRMLDLSLVTLLLITAAPVIALCAISVRLTTKGAAFYGQQRVGLNGATFTMWKIRTMYVDADQRKALLFEHGDDGSTLFGMRHDPRVTRVGRLLRRYSFDELPQLWNVVRGDMSVVGPRPPLLSEADSDPSLAFRRSRVRPGLTGLWQVSGRADLSWDEAVQMDLRYVDNWSIGLDLLILWRTMRAVLGISGAY